MTLPRTGHPSKIYEKTKRKLVLEAAKRPKATLKELQELLASTGCAVRVTTISRILHMSGLWGRVARRKPFLTKKNIQARLYFAKTYIKSAKSMWENVLWSDETKIELIGHNSERYVWHKATFLILIMNICTSILPPTLYTGFWHTVIYKTGQKCRQNSVFRMASLCVHSFAMYFCLFS